MTKENISKFIAGAATIVLFGGFLPTQAQSVECTELNKKDKCTANAECEWLKNGVCGGLGADDTCHAMARTKTDCELIEHTHPGQCKWIKFKGKCYPKAK